MKISAQILTQNNCKTIKNTLESLKDLEIIVCDLGSTDNTLDICKNYNTKIIQPKQIKSLSNLRNRLTLMSSHDWCLVIEPWEILEIGEPNLSEYQIIPGVGIIPIVQGNLTTYDIRLWNKDKLYKFINPVYEHLDTPDDAMLVKGMELISTGGYRDCEDMLLNQWIIDRPAAMQPIYYKSLLELRHQNWDCFISMAKKYLFKEQKLNKPTINLKYYYAVVLCHIKKNYQEALQQTLECLAVKPLMAEFWCLLGDIFYFGIQDFGKAEQFYKNAIIMGAKRETDGWSKEQSKYKPYPEKMIAASISSKYSQIINDNG